jgi:hypothetical protein
MRTSENSVMAKFSKYGFAPVLWAYSRWSHKTLDRYYQSLMYSRLRISEALHKKSCRIGPIPS